MGLPQTSMNSGFTKLFSSIITSSLWVEPDPILRVWIAMLATCNAQGEVEGSIPGFASLCRIGVEEMTIAEEKLLSPDPHSRSHEQEGRRIERIEGGWRIINYLKYREKGQDKPGSRAAYMRQRRCNALQSNVTCTTEAEAEAVLSNKQTNNGHPTLEEVKAAAGMSGMVEVDAVAFWNHFEASGWIDRNGHRIVNWRAKMNTWKTVARASPYERSHQSSASSPTERILMSKELERVERRLSDLRSRGSTVAGGATIYTTPQKSEIRALRDRRDELKKGLGFIA